MEYITLTKENIGKEHICCAFSDKKSLQGYNLKKHWLEKEMDNGYVFRRLDERAKVFIEYSPAEKFWIPVTAPGYLMIGCLWVSGQYKGHGHAKALLESVEQDALRMGKFGLVTVVGTSKLPFLSDGKWFMRQGFQLVEKLPYGFSLLVKKLDQSAPDPCFNDSVRLGQCDDKSGLVAYYSNRCPYTEFYVKECLVQTAANRSLPLKLINIDSLEKAQSAPSPATIFSLFENGRFITNDLSCCLDSRFDKFIKR